MARTTFKSSPLKLTAQEREWVLCSAYLCLEQQKPQQAAALLRPLARLYSDDQQILHCLAMAELESGNASEASRIAARALPDASGKKKIALGLIFARALWSQGKQEAAREFVHTILTPPEEPSSKPADENK